jgi:hypothetical protein
MTDEHKKEVLRFNEDLVSFQCPGCNETHSIQIGEGSGPRWSWNGDKDKPTFKPSVLVTYDHWVPPYEFGKPKPEHQTQVKDICHTFITDGQIQFLNDCTHSLAGQTVGLPSIN